MREIKFRCFNDGCWNYATLDDITTQIGFEYSIPDNICAFIEGKHKTQYTGLKDKNGIEIYEGDIVTDKINTGDVYFWGTMAQFVWGRDDWFERFNVYESSIEVIGNIYENPELIEDKSNE